MAEGEKIKQGQVGKPNVQRKMEIIEIRGKMKLEGVIEPWVRKREGILFGSSRSAAEGRSICNVHHTTYVESVGRDEKGGSKV